MAVYGGTAPHIDEGPGGDRQGGGSLPLSQLVQQRPGGKLSFCDVMKEKQHKRGFLSVVATLTIGIMGGGVLPVAWAFSVTGIFAGVLIMVVVSAANAYTSDLLLRQSYKTGASTYEVLAYKIGGPCWKVITEIGIVILMLGTVVGSIQQIGEAGSIGLLSIWPNTPGWLVNGGGRTIMALGVVFVVAPLCMVNQLRQLEYAGVIGTCIVLWLASTVVIESTRDNLPALRTHKLHLGGFSSIGDISQAVSIFGFAFYIQPILMPLLLEMPPGKVGAKVISWGNRVVVLVNSFLIYFFIGLFGAARYGAETEQNILQNKWLGGGLAQGVLNLSMAFYLAVATPVVEFPLWVCLNGWIPANKEQHKRTRQIIITTFWLALSLAIAEAFPSSSGKVLTVTGATGVCLVCYLIPIVNHLLLFFGRARCQKEARKTTSADFTQQTILEMDTRQGHDLLQAQPLSYRSASGPGHAARICEITGQVILPAVVLSVGIFCSVAALSTLGQN